MTQSKLWQGSSDIYTDYEGTITQATFESGQYGYQMKLTFDEIDGRDDPVFEYYSIPASWESPDGGETIQRVDGESAEKKPLPKSNAWQRFVIAAVQAGGDDVIDALGEDAPVNATRWIGSRWRMEAVAGKPYKDRDTGESKVAKDKNYPTAFLGKDTPSNGKMNTPSNGNGKVDSLSVLTDIPNPVVQSQIQDLAKTLPHGEWFKQSYAILQEADIQPAQYPDLVAAMGGRGLYESLGGKG